MNNTQIYKKLATESSAYVESMFLIAACADSSALQELLEELEDETLQKYFPEIKIDEWEEAINEREGLSGLLIYAGYNGYIAEVRVPHRNNFRFKENSEDDYSSCSVHPGITRIEYIYFEKVISGLIPQLLEIDKISVQEDIQQFKKKQNEKL